MTLMKEGCKVTYGYVKLKLCPLPYTMPHKLKKRLIY